MFPAYNILQIPILQGLTNRLVQKFSKNSIKKLIKRFAKNFVYIILFANFSTFLTILVLVDS